MSRASERDSKAALRLWLRLLACSNLISGELRSRFDATLPRFD